jgi:hypothetical protein
MARTSESTKLRLCGQSLDIHARTPPPLVLPQHRRVDRERQELVVLRQGFVQDRGDDIRCQQGQVDVPGDVAVVGALAAAVARKIQTSSPVGSQRSAMVRTPDQ